MAVPTVYRWDDAEAPVLCGVKGSMAEVLKACLVDGYTGKAGAGWQMEFQNTEKTKTAFRNNPTTCTGFFLLVDETATDNLVNMTGCELMTDIDSSVGLYNDTPFAITKSTSLDTTPRPWMIIATDKFFYLVNWYTVTGDASAVLPISASNYVFMFGDFKPANVDNYNSVISLGWAAVNLTHGNLVPERAGAVDSAYSKHTRGPRDITGATATSVKLWFGACGGPQNTPIVWSVMRRTDGIPYVPGRFVISKPYLGDGGTYNFRGYMPGIYYPCHAAESLETLQIIENDGRTFLLIRSGAAYSSWETNVFLAIEIGADWDD